MFAFRHRETLQSLAQHAGESARTGTIRETTDFGEVLLLALPNWENNGYLPGASGRLAGKVIMDAMNPYKRHSSGLNLPADRSSFVSAIARIAPPARFVRAMNTLAASVLARRHHQADGIVVTFAGDEEAAKVTVRQLIEEAGFVAYHIGSLQDAWQQEPTGSLYGTPLTVKQLADKRLVSF